MDRVKGKVAVVTGAAQGIGAEFATVLAREGAKVVVADVNDGAATASTIRQAGGQAIDCRVDITSDSQLKAMVEKAESEFGPISILVNNAAIFAGIKIKPFQEITDEEWDNVMRVNVRGTVQAIRAVVPSMNKAGSGKIVNISSGTFYYGPPGMAQYTASKGAVIALTRTIGRELGQSGIQVNSIAPGLTESETVRTNPQFERGRQPTIDQRSIKRVMLPEDLSGTLLYLCSSDSDFVTGQTFNVDGGKINV